MSPRRESLTSLACRHVRIEQAVRWVGADCPDVDTGSVKVHCPFGELYHPDGGAEAAMRVYPGTNSAYCFACSETYSPVRLCALAWGMTYEQVAVELLRRVGYKPATYAQLWQDATAGEPDLGTGDLAQALRVWLAGKYPDWPRLQFDQGVAGILARCLGLLESVRTPADCAAWLEGCKRVMEVTCERAEERRGVSG